MEGSIVIVLIVNWLARDAGGAEVSHQISPVAGIWTSSIGNDNTAFLTLHYQAPPASQKHCMHLYMTTLNNVHFWTLQNTFAEQSEMRPHEFQVPGQWNTWEVTAAYSSGREKAKHLHASIASRAEHKDTERIFRGLKFKYPPRQKFGLRFLLHLRHAQFNHNECTDRTLSVGRWHIFGEDRPLTLICQVTNTSYSWLP